MSLAERLPDPGRARARARAPPGARAAEAAESRHARAATRALAAARAELAGAGIEPEYLEARDADDLTPIERFNGVDA